MHPIALRGARTHHLAGVDLDLKPGELVAVTGVSGAGKSSLAFDTLYAEGQRRFVESFSPYARQFLERLERPPMESLDPVAAGIAVDRRAPIKSSRSTLATMADLEAYLSALFTSEGRPRCDDCGLMAERRDPDRAAAAAVEAHAGTRAVVSYPERVADLESYLDVRERLQREGYARLIVGDLVRDLDDVKPSEAMRGGAVDVVVDRVKVGVRGRRRLAAAFEEAWRRGDGRAVLHLYEDRVTRREETVQGLTCPGCARVFEAPRSGFFSYESPLGACATCRGFGRSLGIDWRKVVPDPSLSLARGAIRPWNGQKSSWERKQLRIFCDDNGIDVLRPWRDLPEDQRQMIIEGSGAMNRSEYPGLRAWFKWLETKTYKMHVRVMLARYRSYDLCTACGGKRLSTRSLAYRVDGLDLGDWHHLELREARRRLEALTVSAGHGALARDELIRRLGYLERVGLGYLRLDRQARTLSGGEAQRVSLTAALGTNLTGAMFVLDEPTVGLHPADVTPLLQALQELAHRGNAVLVVEHDPKVIAACDRVVEMGPGAGPHGGKVVFDGTPAAAKRRRKLATARAAAPISVNPRPRPASAHVQIRGARAHNLRDLDVAIPLGVATAVCGPSGSGKSTLADKILVRAAARARGQKNVDPPEAFGAIEGLSQWREARLVDQSPLGRTSRGNAATYTGAWTVFRGLFAAEPGATVQGLTAASFSFNVPGGRCEACAGEGAETVEMQFLADVRLSCPACGGKRFRPEVLDVKLRGFDAAGVLGMTAGEALSCFDDEPVLRRQLEPLVQLGLDYLPLGQPLSTLSGGEAQRLKLARALGEAKRRSLFVLDEPSAGLHATEVARVNEAMAHLVRLGCTVVVVDHDPAVIAACDHVVELGPGAGVDGGQIVYEGPPAGLREADTATGQALREAEAGHFPRVTRPRGTRTRPAPPRAIEVRGAREHNLQGVDVQLPHGALVVVTGPSGSGKSSLAFDIVFAEGQRRFLETLTPYARQFLPTMPRPEVDAVTGLLPSIALEQRTSRAGGNSTVATVTEVAHYLRLLYAKVGVVHCPDCEVPVTAQSPDTLLARLRGRRRKLALGAVAVRARKGLYYDVFNAAHRAGIEEAICDGVRVSTDDPPRLAKTKEHTIELLVYAGPSRGLDRAILDQAIAFGQGQITVRGVDFDVDEEPELLSTSRTCPSCRRALPDLDPRWFSFNTAQGRCNSCDGTGVRGGLEALREARKAREVDDEPGTLTTCRVCTGTRLAPIPRAVELDGERYHELSARSVDDALVRLDALRLAGDAAVIAEAPLSELRRRLRFVQRVGLGYLTLDRRAASLSGGEMQRLRLAAQLGAGLTGALYVLDEPTIGLHPRDTRRLLDNLRGLVDTGSTVLVVEHDGDVIRAADYIVDLGPGGGRSGGQIMAAGPPRRVLRQKDSPTAQALRDEATLAQRRTRPNDATEPPPLILRGARANNLEVPELVLPTGRMVVVAGVSGSGKSTLVRQVLYPAVRRHLGRKAKDPGSYDAIEVPTRAVKRALAVDQSPIGRSSRSIPATFLGVWDEIRKLFAGTPEARARGYGAPRFSFNSASGGGRCEACKGNGFISHEMAFLPDVRTPCEACGGLRFEAGTLEVRYQGLSVGEVLRLSIEEASERFAAIKKVAEPLITLRDLGVGYVRLGQPSPTLSGGEAQRLKLAKELTAGRGHKPTLYVLDEPTTGLHHRDVGRLIDVLDRLVVRGDSLVIIEHHPAVIAAADHVVELGPEGGVEGGRLVAEGPPAEVAAAPTATGAVLRELYGAALAAE
ncbi:MAG: excinuclease ABC subunit UvrA [Myxococcota bacterium]